MTIDDLPLGLRLTRQAGWNQTESDWRRFMSMEPEGCFVAELNGPALIGSPSVEPSVALHRVNLGPSTTSASQPISAGVGTTTTCVFNQVAWIAMVLVDRDLRGRGIGTRLLKHALDYLSARKIETVRLDATPAGRPIYEKLGFVPEYELARFESGEGRKDEGRLTSDEVRCRRVSEATPHGFSDLIEFDRRMTGTDRAKMLGRLFEEFPEHIRIARQGNQLEGFITMRPGANAVQVGPCIATAPASSCRKTGAGAGPSLLSDALNRCAGKPVFVDIPLANECAVKIAQSGGLKVQRCFTRMCWGKQINENVHALWASSGPEKG